MDVVCVDFPMINFLIQVKSIPPSNGSGPLEQVSWQGGGNGSTAMVAAARLGAKAGMIGIVGDDQYGRCCVNDFKWNGIDTSHIEVNKESSTGFALCLAETSTKMRTFISDQSKVMSPKPEDLDEEYIASAKYLHLAKLSPGAIQAARIAKENGVKVSIDAGRYYPIVADNMNLYDIFIASEFYYRHMFDNKNYKENLSKIQSMGPEMVIITLGSEGCVGIHNGKYFEAPTFDDVEIVDTTGAGDVFHGAFIYGLLQGWSAEETARFSNAVSTIKCTRLGGRTAIPDRKMVDRFLQDRHIDYTSLDERARFYADGLVNLSKIEV